jgi:hypothetical protein
MIRMLCTIVLVALCVAPARAQDAALQARVMAAVRAAMAPALPYPDTDRDGAVPVDGKPDALWMVRPLQSGEQTIEIFANPLNEANQLRAARAMAQIETNIQSAQRRATAQYERAVAEAKRTGRSQEVDGVTLSDEGVAGARIDADSHVMVDVAFNQAAFQFELASGIQPSASTQVVIPGAVAVLAVASNVFHDEGLNADRYCEAERHVFLGRVTTPQVTKRGDHTFEVTAGATPSENATVANLVIRLRGNEVLLAQLMSRTDWSALLELLK